MTARETHNLEIAGFESRLRYQDMAKPNKKLIREKLEEFTEKQGRLDSLRAQRDAALAPLRERYEKAAAKATREFDAQIADAEAEIAPVKSAILREIDKGFDKQANSYSVTKVESELAVVEVNSNSQREIAGEAWFAAVKPSERDSSFWETVKVMIGKADKFRSDLVKALSTEKTTHSIEVKLKPAK